MLQGTFIDAREAERTSLKDLLIRYRKEMVPKKAASTQKNERGFIDKWLVDEYADRSVSALTHLDFLAKRDEWLAEGYAGNIVRLWLSIPRHLY